MYTLTYPDGSKIVFEEDAFQTILNALSNTATDCDQVAKDENQPQVVRSAMRQSRDKYWGVSRMLDNND